MSKLALVVDESRVASDALADILKMMGFEVSVCYSARDAVQRLETETPDIVFLDVNMPGVSGLEVCAFIRREPRTENVPIIIVSGLSAPENVEAAIHPGAGQL